MTCRNKSKTIYFLVVFRLSCAAFNLANNYSNAKQIKELHVAILDGPKMELLVARA